MSLSQSTPRSAGASELTFGERLARVQGLRTVLMIAAVLICLTAMGQQATLRPPMQIATFGYLGILIATVLVWRATGRHRYALHSALLGTDGIFLVLAVALSGGMSSPVRYLLVLDVVAMTLLVSYRSGIRLTIWICLLLQVAYRVADTNPPAWWRFDTDTAAGHELLAFSAALAAIALLIASAAAFNERALRVSRRDLELLTELSHGLESVVKPELVAQQLCSALLDGYHIRRSIVAQVEGDRLRVLAGLGMPQITHIALDDEIRRAMSGDRAVLLRTLNEDDPDGLGGAIPSARDVMILPMRAENSILGVVIAERGVAKRAGLERRVHDALQQMAALTAMALRRALLLVELGRLADTDVLTGLANRGAFDRSLSIEVERAQRQGTPLGLIIADLDGFKLINDKQGHPKGDAVLRQVGGLLRHDARGFDIAARYGGEEFAILMPGCRHSELAARAERLRLKVKNTRIAGLDITVSVGAASSPPNVVDGASLLAAADKALYDAKRSGRDRSVVDPYRSPPRLVPVADPRDSRSA